MDCSDHVNAYYTVARRGRAMIRRRRSQFIGTALPLNDSDEAERVMDELAAEFPRANHHAYAYRLGRRVPSVRYSDAGEPSGTAGMPLLQLLEGRELTDCLVAVSRIFGGTLLGTGGLARAYSDAGREAIEMAGIERRVLHRVFRLSVPYALWGQVEHHVRSSGYGGLKMQYGAEVELELAVPEEEEPAFRTWVAEVSGGSIDVVAAGVRYVAKGD
ncbi:MAG: YigZ family protein [Bacillota bacterium]